MSTQYFELSSRAQIDDMFQFSLDYIVNLPVNGGYYRDCISATCDKSYVKVMLSPRFAFDEGSVSGYSTTINQLPDQDIREKVLRGAAMGHKTLGDRFVRTVFEVLGFDIGLYLLAETYMDVLDGFYMTLISNPKLSNSTNPFDFKPYYLAVFLGRLELNYPSSFAPIKCAQMCQHLGLEIEEVLQLTKRVGNITGRPNQVFTIH